MKKLVVLGLILGLFSTVCFANTESYGSTYKTPILKTALNFEAKYENGKVTTSWENIDVVTTNTMQWYKVIKSTTNANPVYPEDGYITAISDRSTTSFVETNPSNGTYYYRVCAIMSDMNRYCSNVETLTINATTVTPSTTTTTTTNTTYLKSTLKVLIDELVEGFMTRLSDKYKEDIASQIKVVETLAAKIGTLAKGRYVAMFTYLKEKFEEQLDILKVKELLEI